MRRRLSADWIFPVSSPPLRRAILETDDAGRIISFTDTGGKLQDSAGLEFYNGVLVPGFINTHCHLELSYLRGVFPMHNRLPAFIHNIIRHERPSAAAVQEAIREADREMWDAGVQAVGDISNNLSSLDIKSSSRIRYHSFVETFDLSGGTTATRLEEALAVLQQFRHRNLSAGLVPHAPYTVSAGLMKKIAQKAAEEGTALSIHQQETGSEDDFVRDGSGELAVFLKNAGSGYDPEMHGHESSTALILSFFEGNRSLLLVHNTFTGAKDLARMKNSKLEISLTLCVNANLYIENRLPDINLLAASGLNITLGTDSLASNNMLSILDEMKTIARFFPAISFEQLLCWATLNGAKALGMEQETGSFGIGKKPGILLLEGMDLEKLQMEEKTRVRRIL